MTHYHFPLPFSRAVLALIAFLLLSPLALALKPSHEADRLVLAAKEAIADNNYSQAEEHLNEARRLGVNLPADYDFFYAKVLRQRDELTRARSHLEQYVDRAGNSGEYYREALSLITQVEKERGGSKPASTAPSGDGTAEIRWTNDQQQYVQDIQELYELPDASQALTRHINNLLKFYAYGDERIIAASRMGTPSRHRIHTSDRGEIVSLNRIGADKDQPFTEDRFTVYGINPYAGYQCSRASGNCWLMHPVTSERWLQIVQNEEVASELAKAVSQLIKTMQKKG